MRGRID